MKFQKTIKKSIFLEGKGLHTGKESSITLKPASLNTGIIFKRKDISNDAYLKANIENVIDSKLSITLGCKEFRIATVEHILAALYGLEIDNLIIEITAEELPIMDGSSKNFVEAILESGIEEQNGAISYFRVNKPIWVIREDKHLVVLPSDKLKISYTLEFNHKMLESQSMYFLLNKKSFVQEIAFARTFCFEKDIVSIKKDDLGKGGSLENVVVIGENNYLNSDLRFKNECLRHKILDLIGALALLEKPIKGYIIARKSGHLLDVALIKELKNALNQQELVSD
ncbi:MAG: UDP-3-O-acyl-N-acetylglucosamine deacetylase [bacterium]